MSISLPYKSKTANTILYILLAFIIDICYFVIAVTGFSLGIGTIIIWVGIPILLLTFFMAGGLAAFERTLVNELLGAEISAPRRPNHKPGWWASVAARFRDPFSWKSLLYALCKFPLSVFSFSVMLPLVITSISLILCPLLYIVATFILMSLGIYLPNNVAGVNAVIPIVSVTGTFDPIMFIHAIMLIPLGLVLGWITCQILNILGWMAIELTRGLLGQHDEAMPLYARQEEQLLRY
jgi:hypothetical protein